MSLFTSDRPISRTIPLALAALALSVATSTAKADQFLTIGTGGVTGIYYAVGGGICRLVNKERKEHGIRCSVESTGGGSVYNLRTIREGELEMGIVQSDWQYHALNGSNLFEESGPDEKLRSLFSLHPDTVIIAARQDTGIAELDDLAGKVVNLGQSRFRYSRYC
ncbi:31 kDa immunogenic protein-like [Oratosquilla oratoria]|uniref:31 kDa immunogenic protein-like n=1 Tax=Oratosquilla oratoria TaxID=337810 RepID=UPI003F764676